MNNIQQLHKKSMEFADLAEIGRIKGASPKEVEAFYAQVYQFEKKAALMMSNIATFSIPRPYLIRSAASLAFRAKNYKEAEKMIALGLSENPPIEVNNQLKEIATLIKKNQPTSSKDTAILLKGKLLVANEAELEIQIKNIANETTYSIFVPGQLLKGIVRKYFSEMVDVQAISSPNGFINLQKISPAA